jgi:CHAD domain-containing protein
VAKVRFGRQLNNPSPTSEEVVRLILAQEVAGLVHYSPRAYQGHDPEAVHQLRVKARRLRSELEIVAPVVKKKAQLHMDEELRWAGKVLGRERDLDVLFELLSSLSGEPSHSLDSTVLADIDDQRAKEVRALPSTRARAHPGGHRSAAH